MKRSLRNLVLALAITFGISNLSGAPDSANRVQDALLAAARDELSSITEAEEHVLRRLGETGFGYLADSAEFKAKQQQQLAEYPEQPIRGSFLSWLFSSSKVQGLLINRRPVIKHLRIVGPFDLAQRVCNIPIKFEKCNFEEPIQLGSARLLSFELYNCVTKGINGYGLHVAQSFAIGVGCVHDGYVDLKACKIEGGLILTEGTFRNSTNVAVQLEDAQLKTVSLVRVKVEGGVRLVGASIDSPLNFTGARIENPSGVAVDAQSAIVRGTLYMSDGFFAAGEVALIGASIVSLELGQASFNCPQGNAILAPMLKAQGTVISGGGLKARGAVTFANSTIGGGVWLSGSTFEANSTKAVDFGAAKLVGSMSLAGIRVTGGAFELSNVAVEGGIEIVRSHFENANGYSLVINGARISDNVTISDQCRFGSGIEAGYSQVDANFVISASHVGAFRGVALMAQGVDVGASFQLKDGAIVDGFLDLRFAKIAELLHCDRVAINTNTFFDLRWSRSRLLADEPSSWPKAGRLLLEGYEYEGFSTVHDSFAERRIEWLGLQPAGVYTPQPFEQLAKVMKANGSVDIATQVLIAKEAAYDRSGQLGLAERAWRWLWWACAGYGYRPLWSLIWIGIFVAIGAWVFSASNHKKVIAAVDNSYKIGGKPGPRPFNALMYSIDTFVPVVGFGYKNDWRPAHRYVWLYYIIHVVAGWFLTTLFVIGISQAVHP